MTAFVALGGSFMPIYAAMAMSSSFFIFIEGLRGLPLFVRGIAGASAAGSGI
ncbi:MAG: DUF2575 domain-containing protein [Clostridiales bacterium]|nr:DUF2575 domain-containing protein [Clostridiales bacterium]